MKRLIIESWLTLLFVDLTLRVRNFEGLHRLVQEQEVRPLAGKPKLLNAAVLSHAMDLACVFYFRRVSPMERSAATTLFLRRYGLQANLMLGIQFFPTERYAWVEVEGRIVNDHQNLIESYQVFERC